MSRSPNIDWYRHLSFAAVGGFFAAYAILLRMGVMANAQTLNLLELLLNSLRGNWSSVLLHTGALVIYMLGTMSTVILPHLFGWNMQRVCPLIDAACAVLLAFFPEDMSILPSLYPIFFAMSVQWSSFSGAQSNTSSTIFSTNNTKQASLSLARHLCRQEPGQLRRMWFYLSTLLCFHLGAAAGYFAVFLLQVQASLCVLPLVAWAYYMVVCEDRHNRAAADTAA